MNYDKIDIRLTKKNKKIVVNKSWFSKIMDTLIITMLSLLYPVMVSFYLYGKVNRNEDISSNVYINLFVSIIIAFLILYAAFNSNKFKKIKALEIKNNRELVDFLIEKHKWNKRRKTQTLIVVSPSEMLALTWGRQFNFFLDGNYIYLNVVSFGRFDVSPFHWFYDRYKEYKIMKEIKRLIHDNVLNLENNRD